jgi:hypothetical protein
MKGSLGNRSVRVWRRTFQVMRKRGSCLPFCDVVVLPSVAYKEDFPRRFPLFFFFPRRDSDTSERLCLALLRLLPYHIHHGFA